MKKKLRICLLALSLAVLAAAGVAAGVIVQRGYTLYRQAVTALPLEQAVSAIRSQAHYTTLEQLPALYPSAVVSVEDRRFYAHSGVDPIAILRALWTDLRAGSFVEGGSTITQQLAKNLYFSQEKLLERKIAEVFVAFDLERSYTKDELLELYINSIYYGSNYYNIYDAAMGYYGKTPNQLTDAECTLLAGLPNAPSVYSPDASPALAIARQRQVLRALVDMHILTRGEAQELLAQSAAAYA